MDLIDRIKEIYAEPYADDFLFELEKPVRILKTLTVNVHEILHLLGETGIVVERYRTGLSKENKYVIRFANGQREMFDESELDKRFSRKRSEREP